ncbi:MAG: GAF domain-containing protein, partial [Anaerolineae bacterium]|nr:GAF domain-containing protein [Anaerolineae bacterium]
TDRIEMEQELRHSLQRRSSQVQISTQIAQEIAAAKDMADLYKRTVSLVNENFNFYHTQLLRYNPTSNNVALVAGYGEVGSKMLAAGYQVSLGDGPIGRAAATKSSSLITDFTESSLWTPNPLIPHAQSELASPIKLGDQVLGILDVVHDAPNAIDADTQLVIEVICGQIAVAIESMRLRTEMEERLRELDTLQTITSGEGWKSFREYSEDLTHGYIYDPVEAQPVKFEDATHQLPAASGRDSFVKSLQVRGETIGSLGILSDPDRPLEEDEIDLLEAISTQVAEALERARLFEQSQRSASELSVLNKMGNAFTESLDEKAIIENILVYASQLIDTTNFYVSFYNEPENEISFPLVIEDGQRLTPGHPGWVNWQPRQAGEGLTEHIIHTRQPILLQDNPVDRLADMGVHYIQHGSDTQSWLGVPLTIGDRILGTLAAQSDTTPRLYTARHLDLLTAVASQAAIALENARLFHQVQSRAEQERLVRTITDRVRRGGDTKAILRITMEELNQALKTKKSGIRLGTAEQLINSFSFPNQEPQSAQDTPSSEVE